MKRYIIVYFGGTHPTTAEEGKKQFKKYRQWLADLGDTVESPANPVKNSNTIHPDGSVSSGSITEMSGYTIIKEDTLEKALAKAKDCPFLEIGGTLEVSELVEMGGIS